MPLNETPLQFVSVAYVYCLNNDTLLVERWLNRRSLFYTRSLIIDPTITKYIINAPSDLYNSLIVDIATQSIPAILTRELRDGDITIAGGSVNYLQAAVLAVNNLGAFTISAGSINPPSFAQNNSTALTITGQAIAATQSGSLIYDLGKIVTNVALNSVSTISRPGGSGNQFLRYRTSVDNISYGAYVDMNTVANPGTNTTNSVITIVEPNVRYIEFNFLNNWFTGSAAPVWTITFASVVQL